MIFTLRHLDNSIQNPESVKCLGVHFDIGMTWMTHCSVLCKKLSTLVYLLRRLSACVSKEVLVGAYHACFQCHIDYALIAWGHSYSATNVFRLQRRAVRVIAGLQYRDDCRAFFSKLNILTLPCSYILKCLLYVHENRERFKNVLEVHSYGTRSAHNQNLFTERYRTDRCKAEDYWGVKFWNMLQPETKLLGKIAFRKAVRGLLVSKSYYSLEEATAENLLYP